MHLDPPKKHTSQTPPQEVFWKTILNFDHPCEMRNCSSRVVKGSQFLAIVLKNPALSFRRNPSIVGMRLKRLIGLNPEGSGFLGFYHNLALDLNPQCVGFIWQNGISSTASEKCDSGRPTIYFLGIPKVKF